MTISELITAYEKPFVDRVRKKQGEFGGAWKQALRAACHVNWGEPQPRTETIYVEGYSNMPKVGDILKTNSDFDALPVGSIIEPVEDTNGFYRVKKDNGRWTHESINLNCDHTHFVMDYKVAFIPRDDYKVGEVLDTDAAFDSLPVGAVIRPVDSSKQDHVDRTKLKNNRWSSIVGISTGVLAKHFNEPYELIRLPEQGATAAPEPDPVQDLADELWEVRNDTVMAQGYYFYAGKTPHHNEVYRALAEFVLRQYDHDTLPEEVVDGQGDTWTLRSNNKYGLKGFSTIGSASYSDIRKFYGVQS